MNKEIAKQVNEIVDTFKSNLDTKGNPIRVDIKMLQGYKILLGEDGFQTLCNTLRDSNLVKGTRGGGNDSKECKNVRNAFNEFIRECKSKGWITRDEEYYSLTKKERFVCLDSNEDRILPSLNMSNVDSKIRKAKESEAIKMKAK
tara:strand:+ start:106 stop:540 length:435 start_codon:yes stop_codon:yes gene_type:complete